MSSQYQKAPSDSVVITGPLSLNGEVLVDIRASDGDSVLVVGTEDATTSGTQHVLKVNSDGSVNVNTSGTGDVNIHDSSGNALNSTSGALNTFITNSSLSVTQGTSPWTVSGTVTANQGTSPWVTSFSAPQHIILDSGTLTSITNPVTVNQGTSPWIVSGSVSTANDTNYGTVGANTLRTAAQIGNSTGAADFNAGTITAQTLRVVLPTDQSSIPVTQSGSWTTGRTWTLSNGTDSIASVQSGSWTVTANAGSNLNTSLLQLDSTGAKLNNTQGSTTSGQTGPLIQGAVTTNAPSYTTAQTNPLSLDTSGLLRISLKDTPANTNKFLVTADPITFASPQHVILDSGTLTSITNPVAVTQSGTWTTGRTWTLSSGTDSVAVTQSTSPWVSNVSQFGGNNVVTGTGVSGSGIPRVTVSNDSNVLATQSGTWTVQQGTPPWSVVGNVASGSADSGNPVKTGAVYNTTLPTPSNGQRVDSQVDLNGRLLVANAPLDGYKATYSAAIVGLVAAATPTDIFTITGSASKTIRVTRITFSGTQNTSAARDVLLIKRSSANSGGTSTTPTVVPHDSNSAAGTAVVRAYTVNPTLGTAVGTVRAKRIALLATNVTNPEDRIIWEFGNRPSQAMVLRGTSEVLAINLNSVTSSNNLLEIDIEWTEE